MDTLTITQLFPDFCRELEQLVRSSSRPDLAPQVASLPVLARCGCGGEGCAHFYTAPPPSGSYGPQHSNVTLGTARGLVTLDVVADSIVAVEVLDRPDVKELLDAAFPPRF